MAEYLSPGVYVEEFESGMRPMEGVSTSTAGFIGMAEKGNVIGTPEFVSSFADFTRKFGSYLSETEFGKYRYLAYAVEQFFANGGTRCYVMRTVAADATTAEVSANGVTIKAKNPGKWGNEIKIAAVATYRGKTAVLEVTGDDANGKVYTVANGSQFAEGDTIIIRNGDKIVGYNKIVVAQGNTITFATPIKEDIVDKATVAKKTLSVCEMSIEVAYRDQVELYEGVSLNVNAASFIGKTLAKSELVDVSVENVADGTNLLSVFGADNAEKAVVLLSGGANGGKAI